MRAGESENCENCVVKIEIFLFDSGSRQFQPGGLQSEPDLEARANIPEARAYRSNYA